MPKRFFVTTLLTIALVVAVFLLASPSSATENIRTGYMTTTFNGLKACTYKGQLHICQYNFPDSSFRNYLSELLGFSSQDIIDNKMFLDHEAVDGVQRIICNSPNIDTLQGIGFFRNLSVLICNGSNLTELDLSRNTKLTEIHCGNNDLVSLIVNSPELKALNCYNNKLSDLDMVFAPNLEILNCSNNSITHLTYTLKYLTTLRCAQNQLTYLDLRCFPSLTELECGGNKLSMLELLFTPSLILLECADNQIEELDLGNCPQLYSLVCPNNKLTKLDISGLSKLVNLLCAENQIEQLDVAETKLVYLDCKNNAITHLEIPESMKYLYCNDNQLNTLELKNATGLTYLYCENNRLSSLNPPSWSQLRDAAFGEQRSNQVIECTPDPDRMLDINTLIGSEMRKYITSMGAVYGYNSPYYDQSINYQVPDGIVRLPDGSFTLNIYLYFDISSLQKRVHMRVSYQVACHHSWASATCITQASCIHCREQSGPYGDHVWKESTDDYPMYCAVCGKTDGHPLQHVWQEATCTSPKHCAYCDETEGELLPHHWKASNCDTPQTCKVCGTTQGIPRPHKWIRHHSCDLIITCEYCGYSKADAVGQTDHQITKMNCTAGKCEICGIELTLSEPKHNFPDVPFFIRTNCLDCGQPNREPLLTGYLYHIMAVVFCLELIVAIWYLVKDKQIRKY